MARIWNCNIVHDVFKNVEKIQSLLIMKYTIVQSITLLTFFLIFFTGCNSSSTNVEENPPTLPPSVVMEPDFTLFTDNNPSVNQSLEINNTENPYSHFLNASTRALLLNGTIKANLFLPASILAAAEAVEPVLNDDDQWEWNYSVTGNSETFSVSLVAEELDSGEINWSAFISNSLVNLDNDLIFEGVSSLNNSSGTWTVYRLAGFSISEPRILLDWNFDSETQYSVELEFLRERGFPPVQSINSEREGSEKRTVSRLENGDIHSDINWNTNTKEGSILSTNYNGGVLACWDGTLRNVECD